MRPTLYFDLVDPLSYLLDLELRGAEDATGVRVERVGVELRPPPTPPTDPSDEAWSGRWDLARRLARDRGVDLAEPTLVPWSRKGLELLAHADEAGESERLLRLLFDAFFLEGADIGRLDVLVRLGAEAGLDRTETKAVLDVDRHAAEVEGRRERILAAGVSTVPELHHDTLVLQGFQNRRRLSTFLVDGS